MKLLSRMRFFAQAISAALACLVLLDLVDPAAPNSPAVHTSQQMVSSLLYVSQVNPAEFRSSNHPLGSSSVQEHPPLSSSEMHEVPSSLEEGWFASPFRITFYCLPGIMSNGRKVHHGAIAADISIFDLGTALEIEDMGIFVVEDRFAWDARQYRLDVWVPDCDDAWYKGVRYLNVRTLGDCPLLSRQRPTTTSLRAIDEMLSFIATERPNVSDFNAKNGQSMESLTSLMWDWLQPEDEDLVTRASSDPLAMACALSWAARRELGP